MGPKTTLGVHGTAERRKGFENMTGMMGATGTGKSRFRQDYQHCSDEPCELLAPDLSNLWLRKRLFLELSVTWSLCMPACKESKQLW
jgi:hypothetical protein